MNNKQITERILAAERRAFHYFDNSSRFKGKTAKNWAKAGVEEFLIELVREFELDPVLAFAGHDAAILEAASDKT